jgi:hypothetical protein
MVDNINGSLESSQLACTMIIFGHAPSHTSSVILQKAISRASRITLTRLQGIHVFTAFAGFYSYHVAWCCLRQKSGTVKVIV